MRVLIDHGFWSDPGVEELPAEQKLAVLWLHTNSKRDLCGFTEVTKRRFEFETGADFEALERATQALVKGYPSPCEGVYWVRGFVRRQIGIGQALIRNNISKSVIKHLETLPEALAKPFLEEYPEFYDHPCFPQELNKLYPSPNGGVGKPSPTPPQGGREGEGTEKEKVQRKRNKTEASDLELKGFLPNQVTEIEAIENSVNSLKLSFQKSPHLSQLEINDLSANLEALKAITQDQWDQLRKFVKSPEGAKEKWLFSTRQRFLSNFSEALQKAHDWHVWKEENARGNSYGGRGPGTVINMSELKTAKP